jgi:hypothetical protein
MAFKFHSPAPTAGICAIHDVMMETLLSDPGPLSIRSIGGTVESHDVQRVLGYRHSIEDGGHCEYFWNDRSYTVKYDFSNLWQGRDVSATWRIVDGHPRWVLSDPVKEEDILVIDGHLKTAPPDAGAEFLERYFSHVLSNGIPDWIYPPCESPENPYQRAVTDLRNVLIDRGACFVNLGAEGDYGFELNSVITALALPIYEPNYLFGRSMAFLEGVAHENDEDVSETISRSDSPGGHSDWLQALPEFIHEGVMVRMYGDNLVVLPMAVIMHRLVRESSIPEAIRVTIEEGEVMMALHKHGYYNPATNHEAPVGHELDAIERREHFNTMLNESFPGLRGLFGDRQLDDDEEG